MARIAMKMSALGLEHEVCNGCEERFERGEIMTAIEYDNGEPAGWHCSSCVEYWNKNGKPFEKAGV